MLYLYTIIFIINIIPRLFLISFYPETGGDYEVYARVAENILRDCGVSLSDPSLNICLPHFGGNHGPGYPFFISLIWSISNHSNDVVRITQALLLSFATLRLCYSIFILTKNKYCFFFTGFIISVSPLLIAWTRYVQTETLSIACTLLLIAELILSIHNKKIRIISISLVIIFASWIRLDNILLCFPIAFITIYIHGFKLGLLKGIIIFLLISSTWSLWFTRNISQGIPPFPSPIVMQDGSRPPYGYISWLKTWITHEYERAGALWTVNRQNYDQVNIPNYAYTDNDEKEYVEGLFKELKSFVGKPFPETIDFKFSELANSKVSQYPWNYWVFNPLIKAYRLWSNPFSSYGWPNEFPDSGLSKKERLEIAGGNIDMIKIKIRQYPLHTISKAIIAIYRLIIMLLFIYFIYLIYKNLNKNSSLFIFLTSTLIYLIARTAFFSLSYNFETRYMVTSIPFIETLIALSYFEFKKRNRLSDKTKTE